MGADDDSLAGVAQLTEHLPDGDAAVGIQTAGGLVQNQVLRVVDQGTGNAEALLHAPGKCLHGVVRALLQPNVSDQFLTAHPGSAPLHPEGGGEKLHVLHDGQGVVAAELVRDVADLHAGFSRVLQGVYVVDEQLSLIWCKDPRDDLQKRGLARAVLSHQPEQGAVGDSQVQAAERLHPAVGSADPF